MPTSVEFFSDYSEGDRTSGTLEQYFDPRINRYHGGNPEACTYDEITIGDLQTQLYRVYTMDAITSNPRMFIGRPTLSDNTRQVLNHLRYRLHYCMFLHFTVIGNIYGYKPVVDNNTWERVNFVENGQVNLTALRNWEACISDFWDDEIDTPLNRLILANLDVPLHNIGMLSAKFMLGHPFTVSGQGYLNGYGIPDLDGFESYRIRIEGGLIYIMDPVARTGPQEANFNRARLHRIMGYSARATSEIAPQIVSTRRRKGSDKEVPTTGGELLYGIELELATNHHVRKIIDSQQFPFFIAKQDSSISGHGDYYMECVTVPMDYRGQRKAWGKFFAEFWEDEKTLPSGIKQHGGYQGFDLTTNTSNGMHIHMTKAAFTPAHLKRFTWMICKPEHASFITYLSERGTDLGVYATLPSFGSHYNTNKKRYDHLMQLLPSRGAVSVNTSSGRTIEVRLFKGIVSYASLLKNLEFCDALYYFTLEMPYSKLTMKDFKLWLQGKMKDSKPQRAYKALNLFISKMPDWIETFDKTKEAVNRAQSVKEIVAAVRDCGPEDHVRQVIQRRLERIGYHSNLIYYGKDGWTEMKEITSKSRLIEHEEQLNPHIKQKKKKAA